MIRIDLKRLRDSHEGLWFAVDLLMLLLLMINLLLLIVDALYASGAVRQWLTTSAPRFAALYQPVHEHFILIDLWFVAIFLTEFTVRWIVAVRRGDYLRWYFFPFVHWYDLVGCIPLGAARAFRFLRIFSIVYRLHKNGIIDVRQFALFRLIGFYYEAFMEELTDRVIVKTLTDVQGELEGNSQIVEEILERVVYDRLEILANWASLVMAHLGDSIDQNREGIVTQHLKESVSDAVASNAEISRLRSIPVVGRNLESRLERAVVDIVVSAIVNLLNDMSPDKLLSVIQTELTDRGSLERQARERAVNEEMLKMADDAIEVIKAHVQKKQWKIRLQEGSPLQPVTPR